MALASSRSVRIFHPPITSFDPKKAKLEIKLTPAITEIGVSGADLIDMAYDPNDNLWLLNNLGAEISELRTPLTKDMVAALTIGFGAPGSKTAGFTTLVKASFDVNAALYVYAASSVRSRLFKMSFPYARQPGSLGINLNQAVFVDSSQWLPTAPNQPSLLFGQYLGQLSSPKPGSPPSPPVNVMGEFVAAARSGAGALSQPARRYDRRRLSRRSAAQPSVRTVGADRRARRLWHSDADGRQIEARRCRASGRPATAARNRSIFS